VVVDAALTPGFRPSSATVAEVIAQIDATMELVNRAVQELGDIDVNSQDVAIEIARGLEKDRWFLFAHISE
jgi:starvation-inducible DNA-binding protein